MAAGAHVIATPMGTLEKEIEDGLTYLPSNDPQAIAATIQEVVQERRWERNVATLVWKTGPVAVAAAIDKLLQRARISSGQHALLAHRLATRP